MKKVLVIAAMSVTVYLLPTRLFAQQTKKTHQLIINGVTTDNANKKAETDSTVLNKVIKTLKQDGIVKDTNHLSFRLDKKQFTVNGAQQSADVTKRYQTSFLKHADWIITYNASVTKSH